MADSRGGTSGMYGAIKKGTFPYQCMKDELKIAPNENNWKLVKNMMDKFGLKNDINNVYKPTVEELRQRRPNNFEAGDQQSAAGNEEPAAGDEEFDHEMFNDFDALDEPSPAVTPPAAIDTFNVDADDDAQAAQYFPPLPTAPTPTVPPPPPKEHPTLVQYREKLKLYKRMLLPSHEIYKSMAAKGVPRDRLEKEAAKYQSLIDDFNLQWYIKFT